MKKIDRGCVSEPASGTMRGLIAVSLGLGADLVATAESGTGDFTVSSSLRGSAANAGLLGRTVESGLTKRSRFVEASLARNLVSPSVDFDLVPSAPAASHFSSGSPGGLVPAGGPSRQ